MLRKSQLYKNFRPKRTTYRNNLYQYDRPKYRNNLASKTEMPQPSETSSSGFVYILRFSQNFLKIGHTLRDPSTRASEWDLPLLAYASADDSAKAEQDVHAALAKYRRGNYELFEVSYSDAVQVIRRLLGKVVEVEVG